MDSPGYFKLYNAAGQCINVAWARSESALRAILLPGVTVERVSFGPSIRPERVAH
jgi:hypothetical protein